ncbi:GSCOCG00011903001-RA-CDS [Cotesia congregata]|nr:GSCOCG00011903001-RA-CDS [Cotesia congregata]
MKPELCAALDRSQVTYRNAIFILSVAYKSVGINLSTLNLSYSTIYRTRIKFRSDIAKDLKSEFHKDDRYVVHWDGKISVISQVRKLWTTTSGPNVPIFVRFKKFWDKVDQSNYKSRIEDETKKKAEIVTFINNCLQVQMPRDDYQELLLLCLVFLDSSYEKSFSFKRKKKSRKEKFTQNLYFCNFILCQSMI